MATGGARVVNVVRGGNQTVRVSIPVRSADGRYEAVAMAILMLPAGDPIPAFTRHGHITAELVTVEAQAEEVPPSRLVLNTHTVCRGPDGKVKWEADTVPVEIPVNTVEVMGCSPTLQITTGEIKTGREHF